MSTFTPSARLSAAAARREQQFYALRYDCPTCGATPHRHCKTKAGRHTAPHANRR